MTLLPDTTSPQALVTQYYAVLGELTALAERERTHLELGQGALPETLVCRKESLVEHYALLTVTVRERAGALQAEGLLDVAALEQRIRHLVALLKDNQRHLNALKVRTAERVEMVMNALAEQEAREKVAELSASKIAAGTLAFRPPMRT